MDKNQQHILGILLLVIGSVFYLQPTLLGNPVYGGGLFNAHRNDFAHLYIAGKLATVTSDFFNPQIAQQAHRSLQISSGLNPFVYPPFFAILLIPLSRFSYDIAWYLFSLLSHTAYFASLALLIRLFRRENESPWLWWGILVAFSSIFSPLFLTYSAGQVNTFLLLIYCLSWYCIQTRREAWAGAILALGGAIKVGPAFLLLYLLLKRRWIAFVSGIIVLAATLVISYAYFGPEPHKDFLAEAGQMSYGKSTWAQYGMHYHVDPHNQAPSALWYRLLTHNPSTQGLVDSPALARLFSYATAGAILIFLVLNALRGGKELKPSEYSLWILGGLMLPSLMWDHYLVQAVFALAVSLRWVMDGRHRFRIGWALGLGLMAVTFLYFYDMPLFKSGLMTLFMPVRLYGMALSIAFLILNRDEKQKT